MNTTTSNKPVKLGEMQAHTRLLFNKGIGNKGTCSTAGATAAKEVTLGSTFSLVTGAQLLVKFTNGIPVANATLAVTHTPLGASQAVVETAKPIYLNGAALEAGVIPAGGIVILQYNGTQYDIVGGAGEGGSDAAYVSDTEESAAAPGFDPFLDTVHVTEQTLTEAKKTQARANIGAEVITYNSQTGMLQKTVGAGTPQDIVPVVNSGFRIEMSNGVMNIIPVGTATAVVEDGILKLNF